MRVESNMPMGSGGWLHKGESNGKAVKHESAERPPKAIDWNELTRFYCGAFTKAAREETARTLGLTVDSLARLRTGWDGEALTMPMSNWKRQVIGIQRRFPDGSKTCVQGSRTGLFIPTDLEINGMLCVGEGWSDSAAILGLGLPVTGRSSCNGGIEDLIKLAGKARLVMIPDNDPVGSPARRHTENSIERLRGAGLRVDVVYPPVKDARQWVAAGLNKAMLLEKAGLV